MFFEKFVLAINLYRFPLPQNSFQIFAVLYCWSQLNYILLLLYPNVFFGYFGYLFWRWLYVWLPLRTQPETLLYQPIFTLPKVDLPNLVTPWQLL